MGRLLPVIKNFGWFKDDILVLKEQLLDFEQSPVIGIAEDLDNMIKYSEASSPENYDKELQERKSEALVNLKELEVAYEVQEVNNNKVIVASGQEFASEKILDHDFLKKMHQELGSDQIAIGIPFQGLFIAISNNDKELINKFPAVVKKHYDNPQADKISDRVFLSINANIIAHAGVDIETQKATGEEPCFVQTMTLTGATEKDFEYIIFIGHQNMDIMKAMMDKTYRELLAKSKEEEAITCLMKFMIVPDIITHSEALDHMCAELADMYCKEENIKGSSLNSIHTTFLYDQDVIAEKAFPF